MPRKKRTEVDYAKEFCTALVRDESADTSLRLEAAKLLLIPPHPIETLMKPEVLAVAERFN